MKISTLGFVLLLLFAIDAAARDINVYLQFDDASLAQHVDSFNKLLKEKGVFSRYQTEPFLGKFPIHITLFLAAFPDETNRDSQRKRCRNCLAMGTDFSEDHQILCSSRCLCDARRRQ